MVLLSWAFLSFSEVGAQEVRRAQPVDSPQSPALPSDWHNRSLFLAGLPVEEGSVLAPLQNSALYFHHMAEFNRTWQRFEQTHFRPKRDWSLAHVLSKIPPPRVLYYMFGGPDAINALAFFPMAETYILVGLEPVGGLPAPETLSPEQLGAALENLRKTTGTTLTFSYFITKDMRVDLEQTEFRGVVPVLHAFLALAGCRMIQSELISIDREGRVAAAGQGLPGVRLRFTQGEQSREQELYYIQADLSDSGLAGKSSALLRWMNSLPEGAGYLKAASYLLHETYFSRIRNFLLTHCYAILQDDSGIPFRDFNRETWRIFLYGNYVSPIELFQKKLQPDLQEAYARIDLINPLPFGTGYQWKPGESNLLLAIRRNLPSDFSPANSAAVNRDAGEVLIPSGAFDSPNAPLQPLQPVSPRRLSEPQVIQPRRTLPPPALTDREDP
jgi:hypothetical protein